MRRAFTTSRVGTSVLLATAVGAFGLFCSCTALPIVAGPPIGGVPLAPVIAFWVASPAMDPEIFDLPSPIADPTKDELEQRLSRTIKVMLEGLPTDLTEYEGIT